MIIDSVLLLSSCYLINQRATCLHEQEENVARSFARSSSLPPIQMFNFEAHNHLFQIKQIALIQSEFTFKKRARKRKRVRVRERERGRERWEEQKV